MLYAQIPVSADMLDNLGVTERQFAAGVEMAASFSPESTCNFLMDIPISDAHAAAIVSSREFWNPGLRMAFHECRGEFAKALEEIPSDPLDRSRLLLRSGRLDEARAALDGEDFQHLAKSSDPSRILRKACRPLEDASAWDDLRIFLGMLEERLTSPAWRGALWAAELDLAWHLDQVPALQESTAGHPLKLAVFHHRLGNGEERDTLCAALLEKAPPARVTEMLGLLHPCPLVRRAALDLWNRGDLAAAERKELFAQLLLMPRSEEFEDLFRVWVAKGGDALPLADLIWMRWSRTGLDHPKRAAVLAALQQRHPKEPRFQLLLGWKLMESAPERAAELFEMVAALPFVPATDHQSRTWLGNGITVMSAAALGDLPFCAIRGLGLLDRQDRIRAVVDHQAGWAALPLMDQVRYLAAGGMDFEMVKVVTEADFTKRENDGLADWLGATLNDRMRDGVLPPEVAGRLAMVFDRLVAGSAEKEMPRMLADARSVLDVLGNEEAAGNALPESFRRLIATIGKRDEKQGPDYVRNLSNLAAGIRTLKAHFPNVKDEAPTSGMTPGDAGKAATVGVWLRLFTPPRMLRIAPVDDSDDFRSRDLAGGFNGPPALVPLIFLDRWADSVSVVTGSRWRAKTKEDQAAMRSLMRTFGEGSPRRLIAEILISMDQIECHDEALKSEARASVKALMGGEKDQRGTEAFRLANAAMRGGDEVSINELLGVLKTQPNSVRALFARRLQSGMMPAQMNGLAQRVFIQTASKVRGELAETDADAVLFRELESRNLHASPEAVVLAKRLVEKAAMGGEEVADRLPIASAVEALQKTGGLDDWVKDVRKEMLRAGIPEVEMLRRLQGVDHPQSLEGDLRAEDYAREILAVDPMDVEAARQLLDAAADEADLDLLKRCLRALGVQGLSGLPRGDLQRLFGKDGAPELLEFMREQSPVERISASIGLGNLHGFFLSVDPRLAGEFRDWYVARRDDGDGLGSLILMAGQLLDGGWTDEAVDLLARRCVTPLEYPGFPYRFPPKPGARKTRQYGMFGLQFSGSDLQFCRERQLIEKMIARIEILGNGDREILAILRTAANPDPTSFERHLQPLLDETTGNNHSHLIERWIALFRNTPDAAPINLRLLEEAVKEPVPWGIQRSADTIKRAATMPGGTRIIADQWASASKAASEVVEPEKKKEATYWLRGVMWAMLGSADNDTWRDYWAWCDDDDTALDLPPLFNDDATAWVDPARLCQVLERMLREGDGKNALSRPDPWVMAAAATGDPALLEKLKSMIPENLRGARELCDLALGDPTAISPVIGGAPEKNGETLLWWNLVSMRPASRGSADSYVPHCPFPKLDGKFALKIMAGAQPDRLLLVSERSEAPVAGHVSLKLEPEQRYVALMAEDKISGVMRTSEPFDRQSFNALPLPLSDDDVAKRGLEKLALAGPGGLSAWRIRFSGGECVDLLECPWNGTEPVTFGAWMFGGGKLMLRCLDADGRELRSLDVDPSGSALPAWRFRSIGVPGKANIPPEAVRLVLSATAHGRDLSISNLRFAIGDAPELPTGFERLTRVPGIPISVALSPDARRLAVTTHAGDLAIVNLGSREVVEIFRQPASWALGERKLHLKWVRSGIYALQQDGTLFRVNEQGRKLDPLFSLRIGHRGPDYQTIGSGDQSETRLLRGNRSRVYKDFEVSDDDNLIIWLEGYHQRLVLASGTGNVLREIVRDTPFNFSLTTRGLHLIDHNGRRSLIKGGDLLTSDPVAQSGPADDGQVLDSRWRGKLGFPLQTTGNDADVIRLFAGMDVLAITADGTLFGVDKNGNVLHGVP